jgi:molybdopterin molybdotransferase
MACQSIMIRKDHLTGSAFSGGEGMITVEKALQIVLENTPVLGPVLLPILDARGMVLADDIVSEEDMPPFDMAMIDGFGLRSDDIVKSGQTTPVTLKLDGESRVGFPWQEVVQSGHAVKVTAGSALPEGTDTIVSSEDAVRESAQKVKIYKYQKPGESIFVKGGDIIAGTPVLSTGKVLSGADIGVLASIGKSEVKCHRRPSVSFFACGNELIPPDQPLQTGKIRAANSFTLQCQLTEYGARPVNLGVVNGDPDQVKSCVEKALESDMFITTSGLSLEDFDCIKAVLQRIGMDLKFWKVAIKPGKPLIFGTFDGIPVFGLPGNYLSAMVVLEEFVRPAILKMQGKRDIRRAEVVARLDREVKGGGGMTHFIRAEIKVTDDGFLAIPAGSRTSPSVRAFSSANGFIVVPQEVAYISPGEMVKVQIISEPTG